MSEKKELKKKLQRASEDLEDLESYIREFSAFLPLAVCTVNPLGRIVNINKAAEVLTGYLSFEVVGEFIIIIFLEKEKIKKIEKEIIKIKSVHNIGLTLITKKEKKIPVSASISAREDIRGNFIGYFIAFSNISEIKALQQDLEKKVSQRTRELRERINELETFRKVTIGRELKMLELKNKIKKLEAQFKK